jgi:spoIIIJ-associated protein
MPGERSGEFRGKTAEAAISAGLAALRVSRDQVEIEIVRPGSRGVLGIGAEDAVVRITVPASRTEPKPEPRPEPAPQAKSRPAREPREPQTRTSAAEPKPRTTPVEPRPENGARGDSTRDLSAAEQGQVFLSGILERMGLKARVEIVPQSSAEADESGPELVLNIVGDDLGVLIGRQNEVLASLELLTRLMVNQQGHKHSSFVVDVNGYRAKRAEALHKLALRMAEQAVESGRTMVLEPMPASERRIIHIALREHPGVTTQSVGEGDHRKVTIVPKKS